MPGQAASAESEAGVLDEVAVVREALDSLGTPHRTVAVQRLTDLPPALAAAPESVVFNLVETLAGGVDDAATVPDLCRASGKGCTGSSSRCLMMTLDKGWCKSVLRDAGLPVPKGITVPPGERCNWAGLEPGSWIVKPAASDASEGIHAESSVFPQPSPALAEAVEGIHREFGQAALVEQYVGDRELNVSVLQTGDRVRVLPIAEIDFSAFGPERARVVDYAAKWVEESFAYQHTPRVIPAPLPGRLARQVREVCLRAWQASGCGDYARVDLRLDAAGRLYVIEINANPDIAPDGGFMAALAAGNISRARFVRTVIGNALARRRGMAGGK